VSDDYFTVSADIAKRWGWLVAPIASLFWIVLWPVGSVWLLASLFQRYRALDHTPDARTERRIARFQSWYPGDWTARYGEEFSELVREAIRDGRGGPRLTLNVIRESAAAHFTTLGSRGVVALACWSLCWIPFTQGFVPLAIKLTGGTSRSWFVALYLPAGYQWPAIAAIVAIGLLLLGVAVRLTIEGNRRRRSLTVT
jgi:hypothetical protein